MTKMSNVIDSNAEPAPEHLVWPTLVAGLVALFGSLYLSLGMGLKACPLCFYQRTFVMAVVAVTFIGLQAGDHHRRILNLLVFPLTIAGLVVAGFHVFLEVEGRLECPKGILGLGTAPQQSLASYLLLFLAVLIGVLRSRPDALHRMTFPTSIALGIGLAWASIASAPPLPAAPTKPYETKLDTCRPPYVEKDKG
jgi:hypothetical protein